MKFARLVHPALTVVVMTTVAAAAHAETLIGLTSTNAQIAFDSASPSNASMPVNITVWSASISAAQAGWPSRR